MEHSTGDGKFREVSGLTAHLTALAPFMSQMTAVCSSCVRCNCRKHRTRGGLCVKDICGQAPCATLMAGFSRRPVCRVRRPGIQQETCLPCVLMQLLCLATATGAMGIIC